MLGLELQFLIFFFLCHAHLFFFDGSFYLLLVLVQLFLCELLIQTIIIDFLGFLQGLFKFYIYIWIIISVAEVTFALVFGVFSFLLPAILWKVIAFCFIYVRNSWQVNFDIIKFIIDSVSIEWFVGGCSKIRSEIWCDSADGPVALFVADGFTIRIKVFGLFNFSWVSGLCTLNRSWFPEVFVLLKLFIQAILSAKCACAFLYFICCFCTGLKELSIIIISFNFFRKVRARVLLLLIVLASKSLHFGWRNRVFKYFFHWLLSLGRCRSSHNLSKQTLPNILSLLILFLLLLFLIRLNLSHFLFDLHLIHQLFLSICYLLRHSLFLILVYFAFRFLNCFMIYFKLFFFLDLKINFIKPGVVQVYRHYELFTLVWVAQLSEFFDEDAWPVAYALDEFFFVGTGLLFLYFVENGGF